MENRKYISQSDYIVLRITESFVSIKDINSFNVFCFITIDSHQVWPNQSEISMVLININVIIISVRQYKFYFSRLCLRDFQN